MKYFTPELLARFQSSDKDVSAQAHDEWEQAIVRSERRWQQIKGLFPPEIRRFDAEQVCLHDAELVSMGRQGDTLVIVLHPEGPAQTMILLTFTLDAEPLLDPNALPGREGRAFVRWMYEEFDVDRQKRCWFEVLLGNGWSVKFRFRDFQFLIAERLFPLPKTAAEPAVPPSEAPVPRSA